MTMTRRRMAAGLVVLVTSAFAGCGGGSTPGATPPTPSATQPTSAAAPTSPPATTTPSATVPSERPPSSPKPSGTSTDGPTTSPSATRCAQRTLDRLSLDERVGQLFMGPIQVDRAPAFVPSALGEAHVGSILLVGRSTDGTAEVATAVDRGRTVAGSPGGTRPIVAVDQEGGLIQHLEGTGFEPMPSAEEQGRMTPTQLRHDARSWGADLRSAGVDLDLAPVADVVPTSVGTVNQPIGALRRGYGSDPSPVGQHVAAFVAGMGDAGVATVVKHFPGLGKVRGNTDSSSGVVDTATTRDDPDLAPFRAGLEAGAQFLMVSLATYSQIDPHRRAVFSPTVIDRMVRHDLGFDGVVLSDDLGLAEEVSELPPGQRALDFLRAGGDIVVVAGTPSVLLTMTQAVTAEARSDQAFRATVDQHVLRVLTAKRRMGLLSCTG